MNDAWPALAVFHEFDRSRGALLRLMRLLVPPGLTPRAGAGAGAGRGLRSSAASVYVPFCNLGATWPDPRDLGPEHATPLTGRTGWPLDITNPAPPSLPP